MLRRLDRVREPTKAAVLAEKANRDASEINPDPLLQRNRGNRSTTPRRSTSPNLMGDQGKRNTKEQFNASPDLTTEIIEAVMETMEVQQELSTRALNSPEVRDGVKHWLLNCFKLYEKLRDRAAIA